jgi:prolyl 4-hydroxylase
MKKILFVIVCLIILLILFYFIYCNLLNNNTKILDNNTKILDYNSKILDNNTKLLDNIELNIVKHNFDGYEIWEINNILTKDECLKLINYTKEVGLETSEVLTYGKGKDTSIDSDYRKCKQAWINDNHNEVVLKLAQQSEKLTGIPIKNQENTQVAMYEIGGIFKEHYDSCVYDDKEYCNIKHNAGERRSTLLVYLNDDFTGGETEFVECGIKIKPIAGKGVLFWSTDENEKLIHKSLHKAHPIISGEKWIATKWSHPKEFVKLF